MNITQKLRDANFDWDIPKHRWIARGVMFTLILALYGIGGTTAVAVTALYIVMLLVLQNVNN